MAPEVVVALNESYGSYGNASSMHAFGREASRAVNQARHQVALSLGAQDDEVIFTSGGSESDNTVFNLCRDMIDAGAKRTRIITSTIEHPAIIETCAYLQKRGYRIDYAPVDQTGKIRLDALQDMLGDDVLLVSVMAEIGRASCRERL